MPRQNPPSLESLQEPSPRTRLSPSQKGISGDSLALALLCSLALVPTAALAQPAAAAKDDVVVMTPFEVAVVKDEGFQATQTLAGSRIAGTLEENPVPITVITRDLIDAIGIADIEEAARWAPGGNEWTNTEQATEAGRYTSMQVSSSTIRGTNSNGNQKNFAAAGNSGNSYNAERYDFGRGPNSVLFGNGAIAGGINTTSKKAIPGHLKTNISFRTGSWRDFQSTIDHNQPLGKTAAIRVNAALKDSKDWRVHEYDKFKGLTLSGTWRIGKNTEFRFETERTLTEKLKGNPYMRDNYSGWDGKTVYDAPVGLGTLTTPVAGTGTRFLDSAGAPLYGSYPVYAPDSGYRGIMDWARMYTTRPSANAVGVLMGGVVTPASWDNLNYGGRPILNQYARPGWMDAVAIANSKYRFITDEETVVTGIPTVWQQYRDYSLILDHKISQHMFASLGYYHTSYEAVGDLSSVRGANELYIDINKQLPNGTPNPHFLEPYVDMQAQRNRNKVRISEWRFQLAYQKQFSWCDVGANLLATMGESEGYRRFDYLVLAAESDARMWATRDNIRLRSYIGYPSPNYDSIVGKVPFYSNNFTRYPNGTYSPRWVPASIAARAENNGNGFVDRKNIVLGGNIKFFQKRLVIQALVRHDIQNVVQQYSKYQADMPNGWDGLTLAFRPVHPSFEEYNKLTYIPKNSSGQPTGPALRAVARPRLADQVRNPIYDNDVFQDDFTPPAIDKAVTTYTAGMLIFPLKNSKRISVFGNYAQTFNPPATTPSFYWLPIPESTSDGQDYGIRGQFFKGKLYVTASRFFSTEINNRVDSPVGAGNVNEIYNSNAIGDTSTTGVNARNLPPVPTTSVTDSRDRYNRGWEFEATYNNTPKTWRLMTNYSIYRVEALSTAPISRQWVAEYDTILRQVVVDTGALIGSDNVAIKNPAIPDFNTGSPNTTASIDRDRAINNWNSLVSRLATIANVRTLSQISNRFNIYTDYSFKRGSLSGLRLGVGVNYQAPNVIGNRGSDRIPDPANATKTIDNPAVDATTIMFSRAFTIVLTNITYSFKFAGKYEASVGLKIDNLFNDRTPRYRNVVARPPEGDFSSNYRVAVPQDYELQPPRRFTLSTSVSF